MSKSITQDMAYRQSLMKYAEKYGVSRASRKVQQEPIVHLLLEGPLGRDRAVSGLPVPAAPQPSQPAYGGGAEADSGHAPQEPPPRHGGTVAPSAPERVYPSPGKPVSRHEEAGPVSAGREEAGLQAQPYEQMTYPGQRVQVDVKVVPRRCIADPELRLFQYTAIDEFTRLRFLAAYPEQSTYSSADFLRKLVRWYARRASGWNVFRLTMALSSLTAFPTAGGNCLLCLRPLPAQLDIRHKLIRPYTPRHNGKVERSHREDQKRFYSCHSFYSLDDFARQLAIHNRRSNNFPMRPPAGFPPQSSPSNMFDKPTKGYFSASWPAAS